MSIHPAQAELGRGARHCDTHLMCKIVFVIARLVALFLIARPVLSAESVQFACDVKAKIPQARTFATLGDPLRWGEYKSIGDVPALGTDGGKSAQVWVDGQGRPQVYMVEPAEDFWTYTRYCFDKSGQLIRVGFEVRTAWGWGYQLEGAVSGGVQHPHSSGFFSTENGKPIRKPKDADDVPNALNPELYLTFSKLPFARFFDATSKSANVTSPP
jgi:hypothetical protein